MQQQRLIVNSILSIYLASFCTFGHAKTASPKTEASTGQGTGIASYYSNRFHGRRTANGERFDQNGLTAMHRSLPFGTRVRITNLSNNRSVEVRINDRGGLRGRRVLDVSRRAATELGFLRSGLAQVKYEVISNDEES